VSSRLRTFELEKLQVTRPEQPKRKAKTRRRLFEKIMEQQAVKVSNGKQWLCEGKGKMLLVVLVCFLPKISAESGFLRHRLSSSAGSPPRFQCKLGEIGLAAVVLRPTESVIGARHGRGSSWSPLSSSSLFLIEFCGGA
jgi:hypothetical protein